MVITEHFFFIVICVKFADQRNQSAKAKFFKAISSEGLFYKPECSMDHLTRVMFNFQALIVSTILLWYAFCLNFFYCLFCYFWNKHQYGTRKNFKGYWAKEWWNEIATRLMFLNLPPEDWSLVFSLWLMNGNGSYHFSILAIFFWQGRNFMWNTVQYSNILPGLRDSKFRRWCEH